MQVERDQVAQIARRLALWAGGALGAAAVLMVVVYGLVQTSAGRAVIVERIASALSTDGELEVSIGAMEGHVPHRLRLTGISVSDRDGPWLAAPALDIEWRPLALLAGDIRITSLRIPDLEVVRLPVAAEEADPQEQTSVLELASLLARVGIDHLSIDRLSLGPDILGEAARLRIAGQTGPEGTDRIVSAFVIERTDGGAGRASMEAEYIRSENRLVLKVAVSEPENGIVVRTLDMPGRPSLAATLAGDGPLDDWRGDLSASMGNSPVLTAAIRLHGGEATAFSVTGTATPVGIPDWLPPELSSGSIAFNMDGQWTSDRALVLDEARLENDAALLRVAGRFSFPDEEVSGRLSAELKSAALDDLFGSGVAAGGASLQVDADGHLPWPEAEASLKLTDIRVQSVRAQEVIAGLKIRDPSWFSIGSAARGLALTGRIVGLGDDAGGTLLEGPLRWELAGVFDPEKREMEVSDVALEAGPLRLSGTGRYDFVAGTGQSDLLVEVDELSGAPGLGAVDADGYGEIEIAAAITDFGRLVDAQLSGGIHIAAVSPPLAEALLVGETVLQAGMSVTPAGLTIHDMDVRTDAMRLTADADLGDGFERLKGTYQVTVPEAGRLSQALGTPLTGPASLSGNVAGRPADLSLDGAFSLAEAAIGGLDIANIEGTFTARDLGADPRGTLNVSAITPVGKADIATGYTLSGPELRLDGMKLVSNATKVEGALAVPLDGRPAKGALAIKSAELAPWLSLGDLKGSGTLAARLELSENELRQQVAMKATLTDLVVRFEDGTSAHVRNISLAAETPGLTDDPAGTAIVEAQNLRIADLQVETLALNISGTPTRAAYDLKSAGKFYGPMSLASSGEVGGDAERISLRLVSLTGRIFDRPVELQGPGELTGTAEGGSISGLRLRLDDAELTADAHLDPQRISADIAIDRLPLIYLDPVWPMDDVTGTITLTARVDGPRSNPTGSGRISLADLSAGERSPDLKAALDIKADWREQRLKVSAEYSEPSVPVQKILTASLPLRLAPDSLSVSVPSRGALSGRLSWQGEIARIWSMVPLETHLLAGTANISARIAGTPEAPDVTGRAQLTAGAYENLEAGTMLRDMAATIDFSGREITLTSLEASDGGTGTLSAHGQLVLAPASNYPFEVKADFSQFSALRRDDITAAMKGSLTVAGSAAAARLDANLETQGVEIRIPDRLPVEVVDLGVTEVGAVGPKAAGLTGAPGEQSEMDIALDVAILMPNRVFVRGRGLDSEWAGNLKVGGSSLAPSLEGSLALVRGNLSLLTKNFQLKQGAVRFSKGAEIEPTLDVSAEHKMNGMTVTLGVAGPLSNPAINLSSSPSLPRDEIVSRILFDKDTSKLSFLEAAQLAAAVAELTGAGSGAGAMDLVRGLLGVDVLRIESAAGSGPAVEAGTYLTEDVYIGVTQGITDDTSEVAVEVELTPNISVESKTGSTAESDIGIKFEWDY